MQNLQTSFNKSIPDNTGGSLLTELRIFLISSAVMATYLTKVNKTCYCNFLFAFSVMKYQVNKVIRYLFQ